MPVRLSAASLAVLVLLCAPAAGAVTRGDEVVVTASRFAESGANAAANVSTITREDIAASPALSIPELLKDRAGIDFRPLYGPTGIDATIDVRGFGDAAGSNAVVLIDGIRLNPVDSSGINWSALPVEAIERIEIVRGSGAVLFGDRAVGGVINIVTSRGAGKRSSADVTAGSYGYRRLSLASQGGQGDFTYQAAASYASTDGWRDNSDADQRAVNGRLGWFAGDDTEVFVDLAAFGDSNGQPGSIAEADYRHRPTFARNPDDRGKTDGYRVRPGLTRRLGERLELALEAGFDHQRANFDSPGFASVRDRDTVSLTPRLRWQHGLAGLGSETVVGMDWYHGKVDATTTSSFFGANVQTGRQISRALYLQNTTRLPGALSLTLGLRRQEVDQRATDRQVALEGHATRGRTAHELALSWQADAALRLYGRSGRVFRFANTDELFGFDPETFASVFAGDLRPQHGTVREVGAQWRQGAVHWRAAAFRIDLEDEIGFNGDTFANENFDDTRRQGVELEADWQISEAFYARLAFTRQTARFREGVWDGNDIPLVPGHQAVLSAGWNGGSMGRWTAVVRDVGERRYSGDFANRLKMLDGYTTADLQAEWTRSAWSYGVRVLNLFDQRYAPFALFSTFRNDFFYFPADRRTLYLHARYAFR